MKEGAVDDESVGADIRDFLTTNAMVKEKVVVEVNNSIILHDVQEEQSDLTKVPSSAFEKVSHEPVAGPSWRI